jgi:hypothetical protein
MCNASAFFPAAHSKVEFQYLNLAEKAVMRFFKTARHRCRDLGSIILDKKQPGILAPYT